MHTRYKGWKIEMNQVGDSEFIDYTVLGGGKPTFSNFKHAKSYIDNADAGQRRLRDGLRKEK